MRIVRFAAQGRTGFGIVEGDIVRRLRRSPFAGFRGQGRPFPIEGSNYKLDEVKLLAPCLPSRVVGVGLNYQSHSVEFKSPHPSEPLIFLKPSTAVIGPGENIIYPPGAGRVDYEGELGVVIGGPMKPGDMVEVTIEKIGTLRNFVTIQSAITRQGLA